MRPSPSRSGTRLGGQAIPDLIGDGTGLTGGTIQASWSRQPRSAVARSPIRCIIRSIPNVLDAKDGNDAHARVIVDGSKIDRVLILPRPASSSMRRTRCSGA